MEADHKNDRLFFGRTVNNEFLDVVTDAVKEPIGKVAVHGIINGLPQEDIEKAAANVAIAIAKGYMSLVDESRK